MELDDETLRKGSLVDLPAYGVAWVATLLDAKWAAGAWFAVLVMALKTIGQARVVALIKRGVV